MKSGKANCNNKGGALVSSTCDIDLAGRLGNHMLAKRGLGKVLARGVD